MQENLLDVFIPYGEVVKVNVKRDKITGHNLGYGFIQFKVAPRALPARRIWPAAVQRGPCAGPYECRAREGEA